MKYVLLLLLTSAFPVGASASEDDPAWYACEHVTAFLETFNDLVAHRSDTPESAFVLTLSMTYAQEQEVVAAVVRALPEPVRHVVSGSLGLESGYFDVLQGQSRPGVSYWVFFQHGGSIACLIEMREPVAAPIGWWG